MDRSENAAYFLHQYQWEDATRFFLAGDCSFRRYERLFHPNPEKGTAILMDAPPPEDPERFVLIAHLLHQLNLRAPQIYAQDLEQGFLLLEDFGDHTYHHLLKTGHDPLNLYTQAIDVLSALHHYPDATLFHSLNRFNLPRYLKEIELWTDWYYPAVQGKPLSQDQKKHFLSLWTDVLAPVDQVFQQGRASLVLRDYHVDNLMRLEGSTGVHSCGLLDFQDALYGPMAYDLVSLLEDARCDVEPAFAASLKAYYFSQQPPSFDQDAFEYEYTVLGAQRATKIIGIFTRLAIRDQKPRCLNHIARVWKYLEAALAQAYLSPLKEAFEALLPASLRIIPALEQAA